MPSRDREERSRRVPGERHHLETERSRVCGSHREGASRAGGRTEPARPPMAGSAGVRVGRRVGGVRSGRALGGSEGCGLPGHGGGAPGRQRLTVPLLLDTRTWRDYSDCRCERLQVSCGATRGPRRRMEDAWRPANQSRKGRAPAERKTTETWAVSGTTRSRWGSMGFCAEAASGARPPGRPAGEGAACPPGGGSADDQRGSVPFRVNSSGGHCQAQRRKTELNISIFKCMN